jgi:hypothetical protein
LPRILEERLPQFVHSVFIMLLITFMLTGLPFKITNSVDQMAEVAR